MAAKWTRPRRELIEIAASLAYRGYSISSVAASMIQMHFRGLDEQGATRRLERSIGAAFWQRYGGQTEEQQHLSDMAIALQREGWAPLFDEEGMGSFWRHQSGITVNSNGGFFHSFQAATEAAYESETRAALLRAQAA